MANERQFFRDISPGDVSIEGRKSNGVTADINGNTIIYAGIKQSELQKLNQEKYLGNVPIDGYTSTFIAALAPGQLPPYPAGNNNNETYFESKTTDPNKIVVANQQITPTPTPQPTVTITPTPTSLPTTETTTSKPAPDAEEEFIFLEDQEFEISPTQLTDQIARHVDNYTKEYIDTLNDPNDTEKAPANKTKLPPITASDKTEFTLVYLGHNQGPAGIKAVLYYSFIEPSRKVPTKNKFTSSNINGNMYGFRLNGTKYVTTTYADWSTNVGDDFNKTFGEDIETSYTPGNFFTYWASHKIPQKISQGRKNIPKDLYNLFSKLSGEYGVPLDYIIATAYIESGFKSKAGNSKYKGMFALSQSEFSKYYPKGDIYNTEQNSRAGVQVLKERVKEAKTLFNQYKSYFK